MVSSTVGWSTMTGWKRRSRAASFSMCLRYSSSVVAPMQCSSPRASIGLSRLLASMAPSAAPAPTTVCSSSMKRMISPCDSCTSLSTALSRSSNSPRYLAPATSAPMSSVTMRLPLRPSGTSPRTMRWARPSTIAVLPTPGCADQHRVVLGAAREDLDDAADLLVAADDRVELALLGERGEVASVLLERLVGAFGRGARHALTAPHGRRRLQDLVVREAGRAEDLGHRAVLEAGERQQHVLHAHELVLHALGLGLGRTQDLVDARGDVHLTAGRARPRDAGQLVQRLLQARRQRRRADPRLLDHARGHAAVLAEQREGQMLDLDLRLAVALREALRLADRLLGLLGQSVRIHISVTSRFGVDGGSGPRRASSRSSPSNRSTRSMMIAAP